MRPRATGYEILGAGASASAPAPSMSSASGVPTFQATPAYLTVRLRDINAILSKEGGFAGGMAATMAPQLASNLVYDSLRGRLVDALAKEGVDAEVTVVNGSPAPGSSGSSSLESVMSTDFGTGVAAGIGIVGAGAVVWFAVKHFLLSRSM